MKPKQSKVGLVIRSKIMAEKKPAPKPESIPQEIQNKLLDRAQEKKQIKIEDRVESIIQGIKKFGIKKRSWFDDAVKEVFGDFEKVMAEQIGRQISVTIKL
jgi:hypothetical protein